MYFGEAQLMQVPTGRRNEWWNEEFLNPIQCLDHCLCRCPGHCPVIKWKDMSSTVVHIKKTFSRKVHRPTSHVQCLTVAQLHVYKSITVVLFCSYISATPCAGFPVCSILLLPVWSEVEPNTLPEPLHTHELSSTTLHDLMHTSSEGPQCWKKM